MLFDSMLQLALSFYLCTDKAALGIAFPIAAPSLYLFALGSSNLRGKPQTVIVSETSLLNPDSSIGISSP